MTQTFSKYIRVGNAAVRLPNRCCYKHDYVVCAQVLGFDDVIAPFLLLNNFTHILEIGTANGGFTYFLHDVLPQAQLNTYDIRSAEKLNNKFITELLNVNAFVVNIFDDKYQIISERVIDFIYRADRLLVVVDGGNKIEEAKAIAPYLHEGDYMMLHDYKGLPDHPEWNKCEVSEQDLIDIATIGNLKIVHKELEAAVWGCMQKMA